MSVGGDSNEIFPVKTKSFVTPTSNISVVVHAYSNRLFIVVSEVDAGSTGTLVEFRKEFAPEVPPTFMVDSNSDTDTKQDVVYDIKVLFGVETPEILLAARVFGSKIHSAGCTDLPILFGFGLKRFEKSLLEEVARVLIENLC